MKSPFKVLDLFAGCGGLSHGFELAGFQVVAANDILPEAASTHQANHPCSRFFLGSITSPEVRDSIVNHVAETGCDVVVGGPPCQAYSLAGARDVDDERGRLFEEYVEIVSRVRPKIFVMENVKGILSMMHDRAPNGEEERRALSSIKALETEQKSLRLLRKRAANTARYVFTEGDAARLAEIDRELRHLRGQTSSLRERVTDQIAQAFAAIGYDVQYRVLNAADFGVPQRRERVVFVGAAEGIVPRFPEPTHAEAREGVLGLFEGPRKPWVTTAEAIGDLVGRAEDIKWSHEYTRHSPEFVERLANTPVGASVYGGFADAWYRQPPDEPARTVKENHGGVFVHYVEPRVMTPRELARLQSFPDDFLFAGSKSKVLVQIGNAVPPLLGKAIGQAVDAALRQGKGSKRTHKQVRATA